MMPLIAAGQNTQVADFFFLGLYKYTRKCENFLFLFYTPPRLAAVPPRPPRPLPAAASDPVVLGRTPRNAVRT